MQVSFYLPAMHFQDKNLVFFKLFFVYFHFMYFCIWKWINGFGLIIFLEIMNGSRILNHGFKSEKWPFSEISYFRIN